MSDSAKESAMRETTRRLLTAFIYSLGIACATGVALMLPLGNSHATLLALVAHLASGALAFIFFAPFLFMHLREGRSPDASANMPALLRFYHRLFGHGLTWCAVLALASGFVIAAPGVAYLAGHPMTLPLGANAPLLWMHLAASALIPVFLLLHFSRKARS